jgi:hypothetical protein
MTTFFLVFFLCTSLLFFCLAQCAVTAPLRECSPCVLRDSIAE